MPAGGCDPGARSLSTADGSEFDSIASEYDRVRPSYPAALVDAACDRARLRPGSRVLEIGCGTGQLTEMLVERGLEVDAIDPGASLVEIALRRVGDGAVRFHAERFEDVDLPSRSFEAVFSGTAFHWIDPAVGWQKAANVLVPSGVLALLQSSLPELSKDWLAAGRAVLPEAATWRVRDPYDLWRGAEERLTNVADLWTWLGTHDLAQPQAATLYTDTRLLVVPVSHEETVESCLALLRTTSTYLRLDPDRRIALESRIADLLAATDGVRRSVELATLVTAKLASQPPPGDLLG